ncbi:MAG: DSD1 family PLP-dependent enzyme [Spirochaetota bacterium]|nr:MAG: DSD1 family PLP-dependent enzyme [Spirochaetota bacterium]
MNAHEYEVGLHKMEIDTPALLIDLLAMEKNLKTMSDFFKGKEARLRPHVKLHKATPILAHKQLEAGGTIGVTCAKLSEAETMAKAGIKDILIANQIVGARKIGRLVNLAMYSDVMVAVDSYTNITELSQAALSKGVQLRVLVEVNIGHNRCGVGPEKALEMARKVDASPGLRFMGLMGYDGHCTRCVDVVERETCSRKANQILAATKKKIEKSGLKVEIASGGGTYTYRYATQIGGVTEIQAGTYLLMDTTFRESGVTEFELTLTVLATVISRPVRDGVKNLAIIDLGRKAMHPYYGMPEVKDPEGAKVVGMSQEHGKVELEGEACDLKVGDKIELWVRDANDTINLYDKFYAIREDIVEAVWDIPARGFVT